MGFASSVLQHFLAVFLDVADDVAEVRWILPESPNMVFGRRCLGFKEGLDSVEIRTRGNSVGSFSRHDGE